jgi:hypothetical protein
VLLGKGVPAIIGGREMILHDHLGRGYPKPRQTGEPMAAISIELPDIILKDLGET